MGERPSVGVDETAQLLHVGVARKLLDSPGDNLEDLLAGFSPVRREGEFEGFPQEGWRIIGETHVGQADMVVLAAPASDDQARWYLISLRRIDGDWLLMPQGNGPVRVRPGKAARRQGLSLGWADDPVVRLAGAPLDLRVVLRNGSDQTWIADVAEDPANLPDRLTVFAWVLDQDGRRLPSRTSSYWARVLSPTYLRPGETIEIAADVMTHDTDQLSPGSYGLEAILTSVNLQSAPGRLEVRAK